MSRGGRTPRRRRLPPCKVRGEGTGPPFGFLRLPVLSFIPNCLPSTPIRHCSPRFLTSMPASSSAASGGRTAWTPWPLARRSAADIGPDEPAQDASAARRGRAARVACKQHLERRQRGRPGGGNAGAAWGGHTLRQGRPRGAGGAHATGAPQHRLWGCRCQWDRRRPLPARCRRARVARHRGEGPRRGEAGGPSGAQLACERAVWGRSSWAASCRALGGGGRARAAPRRGGGANGRQNERAWGNVEGSAGEVRFGVGEVCFWRQFVESALGRTYQPD